MDGKFYNHPIPFPKTSHPSIDKIIVIIDYYRCEKTSTDVRNISHECANNSPIYETPSKFFENNNVDGEEKVDWEDIAKELGGNPSCNLY